jgi:hypothetical protein
MSLITFESSINYFLNLVLIVNIFRIIQCTSLHPRLATLTGTLFKAIDELWHTLILIVLIIGCFAAVGTWRFGSFRQEFATMSDTISSVLAMMFSANFFDRWDSTLELQVYTVLFLSIVYLLILNFLLAIIVDAFMDTRKHIVDLEIEQEFFTDLFSMILSVTMGKYNGWPSPKVLGLVLAQQKAKFNVGFVDLCRTGLFKTPQSISSFMKFYSGYRFLNPIKISNWDRVQVVQRDNSKELLREIKRMNTELLADFKSSLYEVLGNDLFLDRCRKRENGVHESRRPIQESLQDVDAIIQQNYLKPPRTPSNSLELPRTPSNSLELPRTPSNSPSASPLAHSDFRPGNFDGRNFDVCDVFDDPFDE